MTYLPRDHEPYTDKYFLRTKRILDEMQYNPYVHLKVFCRDSFYITPELALEMKKLFTELPPSINSQVRQPSMYSPGEPLAIYEGPAQDLVAYETTLLGMLSGVLTMYNNESSRPNPTEFERRVNLAATIYGGENIPMIYFGARHYPWQADKQLGRIALKAGCAQTSTYIGSASIYKDGVGTTPHVLTVLLADRVGEDKATLETARVFDEYIPEDVPRTILVDTFNREVTDALDVLEYFHDEGVDNVSLRIDTCGENIAECGRKEMENDPPFEAGTGVKVETVRNLRLAMIEAGFTEAKLFVSSGMGNADKARAFIWANQKFKEQHDAKMFHGVGAGNFHSSIQCTADPFMVNSNQLSKTGREVSPDDLEKFKFWSVR